LGLEELPGPYHRIYDVIKTSAAALSYSQCDLMLTVCTLQGYFPKVADTRHGYVPDLRLLPRYRDMDDKTFARHTTHSITGEVMKEGFIPELYDPKKGGGVAGRGVPGVVWHSLGVRYDQCVGNICECGSIKDRDTPDIFYSIHFSCMQVNARV
jgi:hypothetical protein